MTPMPKTIDVEGVRRALEQGAQLVDVLARDDYAASHLPGAVNIPLPELDEASARQLDRRRPVIVYCADYQ
jgi:rhodanese-related sulfurtransferase